MRFTTLKKVQNIWRKFTEGTGFEKNFKNVQIVKAHDGTCTAEMTVAPEHVNVLGSLHGGCTASLVDIISVIALQTSISKGQFTPVVSADMFISFLRPAPLGEKIIIESKSNKDGKHLAFMDVVIKNAEGKLVATGSHTLYIISKDE